MLIERIVLPYFSVISAKIFVKAKRDSKEVFGIILGICIKRTGKIRKVKNKETPIPALIIQPKFITGKIPLRISEANPTTVVKTAKAHGFAINIVVSKINFL